MLIVLDRQGDAGDLWDDFCTTNIDVASYAGLPLNELVFWSNAKGEVDEVELPAFRVSLKRESRGLGQGVVGDGDNDDNSFLVQDW